MQAARIKRSVKKLIIFIESLDSRDPITIRVVILSLYAIVDARALKARTVVRPKMNEGGYKPELSIFLMR